MDMVCTVCGKTFQGSYNRKTCAAPICKLVYARRHQKEYYANHKQEAKDYNYNRYHTDEAYRLKTIESAKQYHKEHPEKQLANNRKYRASHPDKIKAIQKRANDKRRAEKPVNIRRRLRRRK